MPPAKPVDGTFCFGSMKETSHGSLPACRNPRAGASMPGPGFRRLSSPVRDHPVLCADPHPSLLLNAVGLPKLPSPLAHGRLSVHSGCVKGLLSTTSSSARDQRSKPGCPGACRFQRLTVAFVNCGRSDTYF